MFIAANRDIVALLLSHEANPNVVDNKGSSALHLAAWTGDYEIVSMLLTQSSHVPNVNLKVICVNYIPLSHIIYSATESMSLKEVQSICSFLYFYYTLLFLLLFSHIILLFIMLLTYCHMNGTYNAMKTTSFISSIVDCSNNWLLRLFFIIVYIKSYSFIPLKNILQLIIFFPYYHHIIFHIFVLCFCILYFWIQFFI